MTEGVKNDKEDEKELKKKRQAVIVGINEYRDENIPELKGAENDAEDIHQRLNDSNIGDFEISEDHYLIGERATCGRIRKAISDLFWKTDPLDLALFYFSGHGFEDGYGNGYIAPYDMLKDEPFVNGINLHELRHVFSNPTNKANIIILDSCYSGIVTKGNGDIPISDEFFKELGEGRFIVASSEGDQVSKEINLKHDNEQNPHSHGAFTFYLIEGLDGKASNKDEKIFLDGLYNYTEGRLKDIAKGKQKSKIYMSDASGFSTIKIAVSKKYNENIILKLGEVEKYLDNKDLSSLISAIPLISYVLNINVENKKACELKSKTSEIFSAYQKLVTEWLINNEKSIRPSLPHIFPEFDTLVEYLHFDSIAKLDERGSSLLIQLWKVSKGEITSEKFITRCQSFENQRSVPKPDIDKFTK